MDQRYNYLGATIFWLYIAAALFFSLIVIHTITQIKSDRRADTTRQQWLFATLAALSFTTLSVNMLHVLIASFASWSQRAQYTAVSHTLVPTVWRWSTTSTLFLDFANALVANISRYVWSASALLMTLSICLFMGVEGTRQQIPRLYAFFCLGQILPISFTQNLFYLASLRSSSSHSSATSSETRSSPKLLSFIGAIYVGTITVLPAATGTTWLMPLVLMTRALLFAPYVLFRDQSIHTGSLERRPPVPLSPTGFCDVAAVTGLGILLLYTYLAPSRVDVSNPATWELFSHPAVSALGCDFVLSVVSLVAWHLVQPVRR